MLTKWLYSLALMCSILFLPIASSSLYAAPQRQGKMSGKVSRQGGNRTNRQGTRHNREGQRGHKKGHERTRWSHDF